MNALANYPSWIMKGPSSSFKYHGEIKQSALSVYMRVVKGYAVSCTTKIN